MDYSEVFAPTSHLTSLRTPLAIAESRDFDVLQLDVETAFLHGDLHEEIYMKQPQGYDDGSGRVWALRKLLSVCHLKWSTPPL